MSRLILIMAIVLADCAYGGEATVIELGGLRKVSATISESEDHYDVSVQMLAVKTFDEGTNLLLNRDKARQYCLQALLRYLRGEKGKITASFSGVTVKKAEKDGKVFRLTITVPQKGVELLSKAPLPSAKKSDEHASGNKLSVSVSSLLTRKDDYLSTVRSLGAFVCQEADTAVRLANDDQKDGLDAVVDAEEQWDTIAKKLLRETKSDPLLLTIERDDVVASVANERERVLEHLRALASRSEASDAQEETK